MAHPKRPRSLQDGSLLVLDRLFLLLDFRFFCGSFLVPFWVVWGCPNAPLGVREKSANRPLGDSKMVLGSTWLGPFFVLRFGFAFFTLLGSSWGRLGAPLGLFSAVWGSLGLVLGHSGGHFGAFNFSLISCVFFLLSAFCSLPIALGTITLLNPGPADCALRDYKKGI